MSSKFQLTFVLKLHDLLLIIYSYEGLKSKSKYYNSYEHIFLFEHVN